MELYSPWVLVLLALAPLTVYLMIRRGGRARRRFSALRDARGVGGSLKIRLRPLLVIARMLCIALLVVALARPRQGSKFHEISTKGVALELVVDRSGSMNAQMGYEGKQLTRLEVVKQVLNDFVRGGNGFDGRPNDLTGLITYALYADTVCPPVQGQTHDALLELLKQTQVVPYESVENRTSIGDAIALAAARLKTIEQEITNRNTRLKAGLELEEAQDAKPEYEIQSKAIVLLTDGRNNDGQYEPMEAAELAKKWGIKIYTIGIGGGETLMRQRDIFGRLVPARSDLDEGLLKSVAETTGGFYSRADDGESLREICNRIDQEEKTEIESIEYSRYEEKFSPLALTALIILALEIVMSCTFFRKIP
ncbi:MAG: VWA domain-containing protein [Planctomycetes bacterium]|nr:VWA domain-containing protein [Planctomycetota bacterium]